MWGGFGVRNYYRAELTASSFEVIAVVAFAATATLRSVNRATALPARPANLAHMLGPVAEW
jgi:hypothetical protein